jgi:hypothetical protein
VTELILQHQNPQQLSANLWAAVRARGCQFLGPAMQVCFVTVMYVKYIFHWVHRFGGLYRNVKDLEDSIF